MSDKIRLQIEKLNRLYKAQDEVYHSVAVRFGLSDTALWVLYGLRTAEKLCTQYDLVSDWCVPKQTVNSAIAGLERAGYLRLEPMPGTRNRKTVLLTPAGEAFCARNIDFLIRAEERAFARFDGEEREEFLDLCERLVAGLKAETEGMGEP